MFQVPSHPTTFDAPQHHHQHARSPSGLPTLNIPRTLARPGFVEVPTDNIPAEVAHVPASYLRENVPKMNLSAGLKAVAGAIPERLLKSQVPASFSIPLRGAVAFQYPTHVVAAYPAKPTSHNPEVMLLPVHHLALAAHCASVPAIPSAPHDPRSTVLQLPVIMLSVPSVPAFKVVHDYMYHHRLDRVLSSLMPVPEDIIQSIRRQTTGEALATRGLLKQISTHVCAMGRANPTNLMGNVSHVTEFWQDVVALGIHDPDLWSMLEFAWDAVCDFFKYL
ncbi:hypothetical protein DL96DRAFT_1464577 [Flagelloscypha sp. PMI_526]|nr:hypothetical protein DL96DRAFT_1464577 [Flagelloscypha sp. PMI_526]